MGIEDPADLLDDLEQAMVEAGAITLSEDGSYIINRGGGMKHALQRLEKPFDGTVDTEISRPWFVSAPGKVILFGEHAVVHGIVSNPTRIYPYFYAFLSDCSCRFS